MSSTIIATNLKKFGAFQNLNEKEIAKLISKFRLLKSGAGSKYSNMIVEYEGERFHSLSEAYYHHLLLKMCTQGTIEGFIRQVSYPLQDMKSEHRLRYVADFFVQGKSGEDYVIDVKGRLTPENKIKLAYFQYVFKKPVYLVMTSGLFKFDTSFIV